MREFSSDKAALKMITQKHLDIPLGSEVDFNQFTVTDFLLFASISFVIKCVHLSFPHRLEL